jgi:hypothetical protein
VTEDPRVVTSWRGVRARDVVVTVHPRRAEAFAVALTSELERVVSLSQRITTLLTSRHEVSADVAVQWLDEAEADDRRIVDVLARLDDVAGD